MTSNPTIFEHAIGTGTDYDEQLKTLIGSEHDAQNLFEALAIQDIRSACDVFAPVYKSTNGPRRLRLARSLADARARHARRRPTPRCGCGKPSTGRT